MTGSSADWAAFLDSLEAEVRAVEQAPDTRHPGTFVPPEHLGPLPHDLAERARAVLDAVRSASASVRAELHRTGTQLRDLGRHDPRGPKPASSFDQLA